MDGEKLKIINGYRVTASNSSAIQESSVRLRKNGVTVALMKFGTRSNPLGWIKNQPRSPERREFMQQCFDAGINTEDTMAILAGK